MASSSDKLVLVGYDGSEGSRRAVGAVAALLPGAAAVVAYVWQSVAGLLLHVDVRRLQGVMRDAARELDEGVREEATGIAAEGARLARAAGLDARPHTAQGRKAWPLLLELAEREQAALVAVGSRGASAIEAALLGSVAEGLLHASARPVLVVPARGTPASERSRTVIVGYDGSEHARLAIERAGELLGPRRALVVTVWSSARDVAPAARVAVPTALAARAAARLDEQASSGAERRAAEGAALARDRGLAAEPVAVLARRPLWASLCELAQKEHAEVLVVGSHGHGRLASVLLGSVARGAVHHSSAPVLVVTAPPQPPR